MGERAKEIPGGPGELLLLDALGRIAGSDGDTGSCEVVVVFLSVHIFVFVSGFFALHRMSAPTRGGQREESTEGTAKAPRQRRAGEGKMTET